MMLNEGQVSGVTEKFSKTWFRISLFFADVVEVIVHDYDLLSKHLFSSGTGQKMLFIYIYLNFTAFWKWKMLFH